ncbi:MAG: hypothetical protein JKZ03_03465, partial [Flavobacteriaceae bacterium]|nr:hypothetical protein [Flavobacteriaceae bacterium]
REEGGTGIKIYIPVAQENKAITLKLIYFRGRVTPLMLQGDNSKLYVGDFKIPYKNARDIVMNADPKKEAVNTLPEPVFDPPFELQDDEAVISYEKKREDLFF